MGTGMLERKKIMIKDKKVASIRRLHPWVFSGAIHQKDANITDGDRVEIIDRHGQFLGIGHYQNGSISVRVFSFEPVNNPEQFWVNRFSDALAYRQRLNYIQPDTNNCYRLVHAEGDGLPGLIIDIYGSTAVVQCHSIGMYREKKHIIHGLQTVLGDQLKAIYNKSQLTLPKDFATNTEDGYWMGHREATPVIENSIRFIIDWEEGQKTGFFLDQRTNRQLLAPYCAGQHVLNAFCYTGGFSLYALAAAANHVDSVDISAKAIEQLSKNLELNPFNTDKHQAHKADVLKFLQQCEPYDFIICDPPAYAKNLKKRHNAIQGYKRLNANALQKVKPGGLLATFSCSQVIDDPLFYHTITAAALEVKRPIRVIKRLSQAPDHPVNIFHPEGSYLKGLLLYVG